MIQALIINGLAALGLLIGRPIIRKQCGNDAEELLKTHDPQKYDRFKAAWSLFIFGLLFLLPGLTMLSEARSRGGAIVCILVGIGCMIAPFAQIKTVQGWVNEIRSQLSK